MSLQVVGAGLGRTGTHSLKLALEHLLGGRCHHMIEVIQNPEQVPYWQSAADGNMPDWNEVFKGYVASVDWPSSAFYKEISDAFPVAKVLLSIRDAESWWNSANETIFASKGAMAEKEPEWHRMVTTMFENFAPDINDREGCMSAFNRHNEEVMRTIPKERLIVWSPGDGWGPICQGLGIPVPAEPFPHSNTREEFKARLVQMSAEGAP